MKDKAEKFFIKFMDEDVWNYYDDNVYDGRIEPIYDAMSQFAMQQLEDYTQFLLKEGYCDSDVYSEPPSAIDRFMHPKLRDI